MYSYDLPIGRMYSPCKYCGEFNEMETYYNLDSRKHPQQKRKLIKNELFKYECKKCGAVYLLAYDMMYHDAENKVIIYLDAMMKHTKKIKRKIRKQKKQLGKDYRFRIVKSASSLSEKAIIFEHKYDDRIIELIMGDIIAITSNCQENLDMKEIKLDVSDDEITINILGIDTNTGMYFELPHCVDREQYKINEANTHNIIKLKETLFVDFEWCIEQRKKMNKKLKKLMNK